MTEQKHKVWPEVALALVFAGTALAVVMLAWNGFWAGFSIYAISDEARAERSRLLTAAFVVGTAVPLVCAIIAYRRALVALLAMNLIVLLLTLAVGAVSTLRSAPAAPAEEEPPRTPAGCQVHSGSDNTCPGG